jgi:hypothetical protein
MIWWLKKFRPTLRQRLQIDLGPVRQSDFSNWKASLFIDGTHFWKKCNYLKEKMPTYLLRHLVSENKCPKWSFVASFSPPTFDLINWPPSDWILNITFIFNHLQSVWDCSQEHFLTLVKRHFMPLKLIKFQCLKTIKLQCLKLIKLLCLKLIKLQCLRIIKYQCLKIIKLRCLKLIEFLKLIKFLP